MYDAIIIGAGMSGLAAGIRLAYYDQRVCIVERHTTIGGLNSFYRLRGRDYDVGLHALTNITPKGTKTGPFARLLRQLRLRWDDFAIAPQPKGKAGQQAGYKPDVVGLSSLGQYVDDAWELLQFLVDPETQRLEFTNGLWLPQAKSIVDETAYQKPAGPPYDRRPGTPNAVLRARSPLMLPRGDELRAAALKELASVWQGTRSAEGATTAAAAAMNAILTGEA